MLEHNSNPSDDTPHSPSSAAAAVVSDRVWRALSDPSRRRILDLLREGPLTTGELCKHFEFSRFAVMKHLKALEQGQLVIVERRGRERFNHLNPVPIQAIYRRWMRPFDRLGADRLLRLKDKVETDRGTHDNDE